MKVAFLHVDDKAMPVEMQRKLAETMIQSVRKNIPNAYLIQMTDLDTKAFEVDEIHRLEPFNKFFMSYRLKHLTLLKGEILLLDTDILVLKDPSSVFEKPFDVCLTWRHKKIISTSTGYTRGDPSMPYNTGVVFFRTKDFWLDAFDECQKLEDRHKHWFGDQMAVAKVVEKRRYDVAAIPCDKWNYTPTEPRENLEGKNIVHFKGTKKKHWMIDEWTRTQHTSTH